MKVNNMKKMVSGSVLMLCLLAASVCFAAPLKVVVSILPQKYFLEKIAGDQVDVAVMVKPGASPATYEPKPEQMVALTRAKIYFAVGVPFEDAWLGKIVSANPQMLVVYTQAGIEKNYMKAHLHHEQAVEHQGAGKAGPYFDEDSGRGIKDPHVWLSPVLVMIQARNILQALLAVDPLHGSAYIENYAKFIHELVALDQELMARFAGKGAKKRFMVFHPAWGYFAQAYGLEQIPIEIEGKAPKAAELQQIIRYARQRDIRVIFVQPQFSSHAAEVIATSIGGQIVFADPLAPDWADNLHKVAAKLTDALK
jgi:zinc transport system substrate-binding protein